MVFLGGLFGRKEKEKEKNLGLADPNHPAHKEIAEASALAGTIIDCKIVKIDWKIGKYYTLETHSSEDAMRLVSAIDMALEKSPGDLDLLVAKSGALCFAARFKTAEEVIDEVLSVDPNHFEARQRKEYSKIWPHVFCYPPWSDIATTLHSLIAWRLRLDPGESIQIVRDGLQLGVAIFRLVHPSQFPRGLSPSMRAKWQAVWSDTPHGPVVAHYMLIEDDPTAPLCVEAFLTTFVPDEVTPRSGYWLIHRLAATPSCFIVLVDGQKVLYNKRFVFPKALRRELKSISEKVFRQSLRKDEKAIRSAMKWHTEHFDMSTIRF